MMRAVTWRVEGVQQNFGQEPDPICLSHAISGSAPFAALRTHPFHICIHVYIGLCFVPVIT